MNRWRVGEDRGSKETDGCPLPWAKEQFQLFKVALVFPRDIRGEFWCGTMSSGWHSRWYGHDDR
jgi:hypothetical protein